MSNHRCGAPANDDLAVLCPREVRRPSGSPTVTFAAGRGGVRRPERHRHGPRRSGAPLCAPPAPASADGWLGPDRWARRRFLVPRPVASRLRDPSPARRPPPGSGCRTPGVRAGDLDVPNDVVRTLASLLDGTPQVFADPAHDGELCATGDGPRSARGNGRPAAARSGPRRGPAQQGNQWRRRIQPATDLGVRGHDSLPGGTNSSVGT